MRFFQFSCFSMMMIVTQVCSSSIEEEEMRNHLVTLAQVNRFKLPSSDFKPPSEAELLGKVYLAADSQNQDLQSMLTKFSADYKTVSGFKEALKKTVYYEGPEAGHQLIMQFSYVLIAFENLKNQTSGNPLWDYYITLIKTTAIRISRPGYDEDTQDMLNIEQSAYNVISKVSCLFVPSNITLLSETLQYGRQNAERWARENKLENSLIIIEGEKVMLCTQDIESVLAKIPTQLTSLRCNHALNDQAALLLLAKLDECEKMNTFHLLLDNPSGEILKQVIAFLKGKKTLKKCEIEYSEMTRMNPENYKFIKELDNLLLFINPRMMD